MNHSWRIAPSNSWRFWARAATVEIEIDSVVGVALRRIVADGPALPSRERPGIARDLEAICLTCLEKSPARRYGSASELADDLRRFLSGEPTVARPSGAAARILKWLRRRPAVAAVLAVACLSLATIIAGQQSNNARLATALHDAQTQRERAEKETATSRRLLYSADVRLAYEAWEGNNLPRVLELLSRQVPSGDEEDLREFAWHLLWKQCHAESLTIDHPDTTFGVVFSPDGETLATACKDGTARIWDAPTGELRDVLSGHTGEITAVSYSPSGDLLATASEDHTVRLW